MKSKNEKKKLILKIVCVNIFMKWLMVHKLILAIFY